MVAILLEVNFFKPDKISTKLRVNLYEKAKIQTFTTQTLCDKDLDLHYTSYCFKSCFFFFFGGGSFFLIKMVYFIYNSRCTGDVLRRTLKHKASQQARNQQTKSQQAKRMLGGKGGADSFICKKKERTTNHWLCDRLIVISWFQF